MVPAKLSFNQPSLVNKYNFSKSSIFLGLRFKKSNSKTNSVSMGFEKVILTNFQFIPFVKPTQSAP